MQRDMEVEVEPRVAGVEKDVQGGESRSKSDDLTTATAFFLTFDYLVEII